MLTITFLGTGTSQGIPIIGSDHPVCLSDNPKDKRLRSSIRLQWEGFNYVIDCSPDFRQQMLHSKTTTLDGMLFTHEHADHTAGFDDIRPFSFLHGEVPIYAEQRVLNELSVRFEYAFRTENRYPGSPKVNAIPINPENHFTLKNKTVIPIRVLHNQLPILGYRIDNFAYLTDVKTIPESEFDKLRGLDTLVLNALRLNPHDNHLNLEEALQLAGKINPNSCYFTHISHLLGFHDKVSQALPKTVFLAYDGLTITSH